MTSLRDHHDVAIVGGGPVGLYLAAELARRGVDCVVLERSVEPHRHSRSIGIHPPALTVLEPTGATARILEDGVGVRVGRAFSGTRPLGTLAFDVLDERHPYVVTLPQHRTEAILRERLRAFAPAALRLGWSVEDVSMRRDHVVLAGVRRAGAAHTGAVEDGMVHDGTVHDSAVHGSAVHDSAPYEIRARVVVGCDGRDSTVRSAVAIKSRRRTYPDTYLMGDVRDDTDLGHDAAIYLTPEGVVESFPLPGGTRRWVVKTPARSDAPGPADLAARVRQRLGISLDVATCSMISSFGIERGAAARLGVDRVLLAGDSAHLLPPIGGQGMNLGWLDAADLAAWLPDALAVDPWSAERVRGYERRRTRAYRTALRRAEWNVRLGRGTRWTMLRDAAVRILLSGPGVIHAARMFTMHGLATAPD